MTPRIDRERLLGRLDSFNRIGALPGGGNCRLALSDEDRAGRDLLVRWMRELDLAVTVDAIGNIVGGALITEVIFAYPGLGYLIYNAIRQSDFPVVQGSVLLLVICTAGANLVLDLVNPMIDPRIRATRS